MNIEAATNCRRCGRHLDPAAPGNDVEYQESILISFRAGYASIFGDGNVITTVLCQHCVQAVLGPWLEISEDDPFNPQVRPLQPRGGYQAYQVEALSHPPATPP